jgi:hypothetical protein
MTSPAERQPSVHCHKCSASVFYLGGRSWKLSAALIPTSRSSETVLLPMRYQKAAALCHPTPPRHSSPLKHMVFRSVLIIMDPCHVSDGREFVEERIFVRAGLVHKHWCMVGRARPTLAIGWCRWPQS